MKNRKHMIEIVNELNELNDISDEKSNEICDKIISDISSETHGMYQFRIEHDGYIKGDATLDQIQKDLNLYKVETLDQVLDILDAQFIERYQASCAPE